LNCYEKIILWLFVGSVCDFNYNYIKNIFFYLQNNKKPCRKPAINPEIVFEVLSKKKHLIFIGEQLKLVSVKIWTELSHDIQNKMTPNSLYISKPLRMAKSAS